MPLHVEFLSSGVSLLLLQADWKSEPNPCASPPRGHDFIHSSHKLLPTILSCGYSAQHCRLVCFAGDLEHSKSTSGRILCIFGSRTVVSISWICKKQTSVSHNSTESEIISLDAGLRMDGIPALDLWDLVIEVLRSTTIQAVKPRPKHQLKRAAEMLINCQLWITCPQTHILLKASLSCTFLKTTDQRT